MASQLGGIKIGLVYLKSPQLGWRAATCLCLLSLLTLSWPLWPGSGLVSLTRRPRPLPADFTAREDSAAAGQVDCGCQRAWPAGGSDGRALLAAGRAPPDGSYVGRSSCNAYTEQLGSGQRVLSYSYYSAGGSGREAARHWYRYLGLGTHSAYLT